MSKKDEDIAIRRMFLSPLQAAYWIRTEVLKDIVGLELIFEDGSRIQITSKEPIGVKIYESIRTNNKHTGK